jgi:phospholipid/cholesterol/gamma-HCH transport system substrate-binding protein
MRNTDLNRRSRRLFGLIGACAIGGSAIAAYLGIRTDASGSTHLQASFGRAGQGLDQQSDVKIRGIVVGGVASVRLKGDGGVEVRLRLDHGVRVPATTSLAIQPLSVFGPKFVDLEPGSGEGTGPFLADGATITRTRDPQELTDIVQPSYDLLKAVDPGDVATILHTLSAGLNGRGEELSRTLDNASKLLDVSVRNASNLKTLIGNGAELSGTFADRSGEIASLVEDLNTVGAAIAADPAAFRRLIVGGGQVADQVTALLMSDPGGPGRIITSIIPALDVSYTYRANTPLLISAVGGFFNQSAGILKAQGPNGTLLATQTVHMDLSDPVCSLVLDLCRPYPKALPYPKIGGK